MTATTRERVADGYAIVSPETGRLIIHSIRSTEWATLLCWWRDYNMNAAEFHEAGFRCVPVNISRADAAMAAMQGGGVPNGWQLVPKEPTDQMIWDGGTALHDLNEDSTGIYRAMLAAAPTPPSQTEETDHA